MNITMELRGVGGGRNEFEIGVGGDGQVDLASSTDSNPGIVEEVEVGNQGEKKRHFLRAVAAGSTVVTYAFKVASGAPLLPVSVLNITVTTAASDATETGFHIGPVLEGLSR